MSDIKNHDVRTEGMGYAMMVFVQLGYQAQFDRVWAWVQVRVHLPPARLARGRIGTFLW